LTKSAQDMTNRPNSPSMPASNCGAAIGSFGSLFRLSWPRGAFRSSDATAQILANHGRSLARDDSELGSPVAPDPVTDSDAGHDRVGHKRTGRPFGRLAGLQCVAGA